MARAADANIVRVPGGNQQTVNLNGRPRQITNSDERLCLLYKCCYATVWRGRVLERRHAHCRGCQAFRSCRTMQQKIESSTRQWRVRDNRMPKPRKQNSTPVWQSIQEAYATIVMAAMKANLRGIPDWDRAGDVKKVMIVGRRSWQRSLSGIIGQCSSLSQNATRTSPIFSHVWTSFVAAELASVNL